MSGPIDPIVDAQELSQHLAWARVRDRLPSIAAAVLVDGDVAWTDVANGDDQACTLDSQYRIGSITKTLTAVEIMRLRDDGALDLNDRLGQHLPELEALPVTIAQLLSHTSGLQAETNGPWWERIRGGSWAELIDVAPRLVATPGTRFHYSNLGYGILGEVVERLRGASWWDAVRTGIVEPLGMTRTSFDASGESADGWSIHPSESTRASEPAFDGGAMAPAGQLWSTVTNLASWAHFAAFGHPDVLATSSLREMQIPLAVDDRPDQPWASAQGLGWRVWADGARRFVGHGGSMPGFLSIVKVDPQTGDGVIVLTNSTNGLGNTVDELMGRIEPPDHPPAAATGEADPEVEALTGDWFWGPERFRLEARPDGFWLGNSPSGRASRFVRRDGAWVGLDTYFAGEELRLRDDGALELATFVLTRTPYDPEIEVPGGTPQWEPRG